MSLTLDNLGSTTGAPKPTQLIIDAILPSKYNACISKIPIPPVLWEGCIVPSRSRYLVNAATLISEFTTPTACASGC